MVFAELVCPAHREVFRANFARLQDCGEVQGIEYDLLRRDGSLLPVILNSRSGTSSLSTMPWLFRPISSSPPGTPPKPRAAARVPSSPT